MSTTLTREGLDPLIADVKARGRRALLDAAQPQHRAAVLIAAAAAGEPPDVAEMARAFDATPSELLAALVIATPGERAPALVELVDRRRLSPEHEGYALLFASLLVSTGEPAPPKLLPVLRKKLLAEVGVEATLALCAAANITTDPECHKLERDLAPWAPVGSVKKLVAETRRRFADNDLRLALPERAEGAVVSGFTARRVTPKVGRNDACPCGSGKKYKKCCETKDAARGLDPSPVPGMTRPEWIAAGAPNLSVDDVLALSREDLARVDPAQSPLESILRLFTVSLGFGLFDVSARILDDLGRREASLPKGETLARLTNDAIVEALRAGSVEAANRLAARVEDPASLPLDLQLSLRFAKFTELAVLDEIAKKALLDPEAEECIALPYAVLDHAPSLGVLVALGSLAHLPSGEARTLLDEVEEARVRAGLPAETAGWDIVAGFEKLDGEVAEDDRSRKQLEVARADAERQLFDVERRLRAAEERAATHEARAAAAEARVAELTRASDRDLARLLEAEMDTRRRAEAKAAELRALVADGVKERGDLRRRVAELEAARAAAPSTSTRESAEIPSAPISDDEPMSGSVIAPRGLHVPNFDDGALASMKRLPKHVSEDALAVAAALGGGKGWHNVKQMQDIAPPLFSVRLGIHHRMLFRIEQDRLQVCDVLPRESLDSQLKRYR